MNDFDFILGRGGYMCLMAVQGLVSDFGLFDFLVCLTFWIIGAGIGFGFVNWLIISDCRFKLLWGCLGIGGVLVAFLSLVIYGFKQKGAEAGCSVGMVADKIEQAHFIEGKGK